MRLAIYPRASGSGRCSSPATDTAFPFLSGLHNGRLRCIGILLCIGLFLWFALIPTPRPPMLRRFECSDHVLLTLVNVYVFDCHLLLALAAIVIEGCD